MQPVSPNRREDPDTVATLASQKLMRWLVERLAKYILQNDVHGAHRGPKHCAHEVSGPRYHLRVVLHPPVVLAYVVLAQFLKRVKDCSVVCLQASLTIAHDALIRVRPHEQTAADQERLDIYDLHDPTSSATVGFPESSVDLLATGALPNLVRGISP